MFRKQKVICSSTVTRLSQGAKVRVKGIIGHVVGIDEELGVYLVKLAQDHKLDYNYTVITSRINDTKFIDESVVTLDITPFIYLALTDNAIFITGRAFGENIRKQINIDKYDNMTNIVKIVFTPKEYVSMSSSFLQGMFDKSIKLMGHNEFRRRYIFPNEMDKEIHHFYVWYNP